MTAEFNIKLSYSIGEAKPFFYIETTERKEMMHMKSRKYIPAWQVVRELARKHGYNPAWVWDVLDDYFNMRRGEGCLMTREEAEELEHTLEYIDAEQFVPAYI